MTIAKQPRVKMRHMAPPTLAGKRMLLLMHQVAEKKFNSRLGVRGTQKKVAEYIGLERTLASKLKKGGRVNVAVETIEAVMKKTRLRPDFFHKLMTVEPYFEDFIEQRPVERPETAKVEPEKPQPPLAPNALDDLFDDLNASELERDIVRNDVFRRHPEHPIVSATVSTAIIALRAGRKRQEAVDAAIEASVDNEVTRTGRRKPPADKPPDDSKT